MTTADGPPPSARRPVNRLTPARVRSVQFPRAAVGRRGYSGEAVDQFVRRMAEEITARDAAEANLRAQLDRVRRALKQWQSRQLERRSDTGTHPVVTDADPATPEHSVEAVNTLSQAQQQADAYIAQAQEYCRQITADARNRADAILCEAQERAEATTAQALRTYEARQAALAEQEAALAESARLRDEDLTREADRGREPANGVAVDLDELDRRLNWARTFVSALQSVETQLSSSREALSVELDALDRLRQPAADAGATADGTSGEEPPAADTSAPAGSAAPELAPLQPS
jgi:DivIVA domain-containing protein